MLETAKMIDSSEKRTVYLMYGSGGGGHKASATAIKAVLQNLRPDWEIVFHNASVIAGMAFGDSIYNKILELNMTRLIPMLYVITGTFQPLVEPSLKNKFVKFGESTQKPDAVVSFVPFLNKVMCEALPESVHMTVLTDFTHSRAHPWLQTSEQNVCVGTDKAEEQARDLGFDKIVRVSGMVVNPSFYERFPEGEIADLYLLYGLERNLPTFLIMFGSHPPTKLCVEVVEALSRRTDELANCICICGRNEELRLRLVQMQRERQIDRTMVIGFTDKIPMLMQMSDVIVGKPGPGVVSEALVSARPLILLGSKGSVMEQEKDVLDWVVSHNVGRVVEGVDGVASTTAEEIRQFQSSVDSLPPNRAVFEVAERLTDILSRGCATPS